MKKWKLIIATLTLVTIAGGTWFTVWANTLTPAPVAQTQAIQKPTPQPPTVDELLRLVNEERAKVGVAPLRVDERVQRSAQLKATDMDINNYASHIMPSTGKVLSPEMDSLLSSACIDSSENLTVISVKTTERAIYNWVHSEPHYKAMTDPRYESTGFGIANSTIVQHFCNEQ